MTDQSEASKGRWAMWDRIRSDASKIDPAEVVSSVGTYRMIRGVVGVLGLALPWALVVLTWIANYVHRLWVDRSNPGLDLNVRSSISSYYYTEVRGVFVGTLFAIGLLLLTYSYRSIDTTLTTVACFCAIGVALFPTPEDGKLNPFAVLHYVCAGLLFLVFGILAFWRFPISDDPQPDECQRERQRKRARLYRICGGIIFAAIALSIVLSFVEKVLGAELPALWLLAIEVVMVEAFGLSWLVKGGKFPRRLGLAGLAPVAYSKSWLPPALRSEDPR